MSTASLLEEIQTNCKKINRCKTELSEEDLNGKYQKSFETLTRKTIALANEAIKAALFGGLKCYEATTQQLELSYKALIDAGWYSDGLKRCGLEIKNGEATGLLQFLCRLRRESEKIVFQYFGTLEDEEEYILWQKIEETFGSMPQGQSLQGTL